MNSSVDILARRLFQAGCRHAFGIPGGEVLAVMAALDRAGIRFELCKHENSGGFMAEGTHHVTGAPGILLATLGPGVANAANVMANALQDQVPLIFITGCVDGAESASYTHQVFDHGAMLAPITKASLTLADGAVDVLADKAIAIATAFPPGPVHIDVPISVATADQGAERNMARAPPQPLAPAPGPAWRAARDCFAAARRPILIAGVGVLHDAAAAEVADFARAFQVPVITTYKAKGVLPENQPLALGGAGLSPLADQHLLPLLGQSDCIILAGYDPIEMRAGWRDPWPAGADVIELGGPGNTHYMHRARWSFRCHVGAGLAALGADGGGGRNETWPGGETAATRQALVKAHRADEVWGPAALVDEIQKHSPPDAIATADSGAHRILLSQVWQCLQPRGLLQSSALCTMGCALPLAIGAKLADPDRTVIAFMGDAGLEMVMGELATVRDLRQNIVIVVFVDRSLALIEKKQRESGFAKLGVSFGATDFVALADALGGHGVAIEGRSGIAGAIAQAQTRQTFTLLACEIGDNAYDGRI
ncbi:MAG: thiamine pyrophosphate-binding protein [Alphaproteobacteria bacterium]